MMDTLFTTIRWSAAGAALFLASAFLLHAKFGADAADAGAR